MRRGSRLSRRRRRGEERRGGEEQATDIKSNNPHLAGGEKHSFSENNLQLVEFPTSIFVYPIFIAYQRFSRNLRTAQLRAQLSLLGHQNM